MDLAGELELDLHNIVEWGDRWLVTFNATKAKLLSFKRHRDLLLVPVEMNGIDLPDETSFCLLGLTFTHLWTGCHIYSPLPRQFKGKRASFIHLVSVQIYQSAMYGVLFPYVGWCSKVLDLLDRVQKRVVSLVDSGLSSDLQSLSHRRNAASLSMF